MPPKETDRLVSSTTTPSPIPQEVVHSPSLAGRALLIAASSFNGESDSANTMKRKRSQRKLIAAGVLGFTVIASVVVGIGYELLTPQKIELVRARTGPYRLSELHSGHDFASFYDFYEGADSEGSAGFNTYTPYERAMQLGLINVTTTLNATAEEQLEDGSGTRSGDSDSDVFFYIQSLPTEQGPRESVRMEGKTRFNAGLFILDLDHMPTGCGQWPAFWLTDEDRWPDAGEIDVVEGINYQSNAKTALHTSAQCSQYAHVPDYKMTGHWDRATGIPNTFTGMMDFNTSVPADNCWVQAPHQWQNQGCVAISDRSDTLGSGLNSQGGGIFALQWDPEYRQIRTWVFPKALGIPSNLKDSMDYSTSKITSATPSNTRPVAPAPDPDSWGLPYGYFAIGETTGCSADHFQNMRIVLNTAFCGTVAGNRFFTDCPKQAAQFNVSGDPVKSCNAWIASDPDEMAEAYWKIRGVHVYQRAWEVVPAADEGQ